MRVIVSLGLCDASGVEAYRANNKTAALTQPIGRDGVPCMYVFKGFVQTCMF